MLKKHLSEIRAFNRFYTRFIGLLDKHILDSPYSLPEARILYELYHHETITASDIITSLGIDKGYLSRVLLHFEKKKLLVKKRVPEDKRSVYLGLTALGKKEFETINNASNNQLINLLEHLPAADADKLIQHMLAIKTILSKNSNDKI